MLARPTRPVPFKVQMLNPSRRTARHSVALPPLAGYTRSQSDGVLRTSSQASPTASEMPLEMPLTSASESTLQPINADLLMSRIDMPNTYKRDHLTIWGGAEYMRQRPPIKSRYLTWLPDSGSEAAERSKLRRVEIVKRIMRESARIFQKADANGDGSLDFPEFCDLVKLQARLQRRAHALSDGPKPKGPTPIPSRQMLLDWFHLIDANHSGALSMTEFFAFSLREALAQEFEGEPNLAAFLSIWDTDNNQVLDKDEFDKVTTSLGFASITKELMEMCHVEPDGRSVKIESMTLALRQKAEDEEERHFFEVATQMAQRPVEVVSKRGRKIIDADRPLSRQKKKGGARGPTSGKKYAQLFPEMEAETSFSIVQALSKVDQDAQKSTFYDPKKAETQKKEDVGQALAILRSWMRRKVCAQSHSVLETQNTNAASAPLMRLRLTLANRACERWKSFSRGIRVAI